MGVRVAKAFIPCAIVLIITLLPIGLFLFNPAPLSFTDYLREVRTRTAPSTVYPLIEDYIQFRIHLLQPQPNTQNAVPVAEWYFRLAETLYQREEGRLLGDALRFYQKAIHWHAGVRHGWGYFQVGRIYEHRAEWRLARESYEKVNDYDFGFLSLRAGYRHALMQKEQGETVNSEWLYNYCRYFPREEWQHRITAFADAIFADRPKSNAVKGLIAVCQEKEQIHAANEATPFFQKYLALYPQDAFIQFLYPAEMYALGVEYDLLQSYYAPRGLQNGGIVLLEDGHFISDYYLMGGGENSEVVIEAELEKPANIPKTVYLSLTTASGRRVKSFLLKQEKQTIQACFPSPRTRGIVDMYFTHQKGEDPAVSWIKITHAHA
ncbi:hypothetical protein GF373_01110, partial [bacterium]|nr:hypothetical protein [bacterium]